MIPEDELDTVFEYYEFDFNGFHIEVDEFFPCYWNVWGMRQANFIRWICMQCGNGLDCCIC